MVFGASMSETFLDGAIIVAVFKEVRREGMPERMARDPFCQADFPGGIPNRALQDVGIRARRPGARLPGA